MNHQYRKAIACLLFSFWGVGVLSAQPEFLQCTSEPISLCVQDEGVRLPANNQIYLGEGIPDVTSCSVHVTQKKKVRSTCGTTLQYQVQIFLHDTSIANTLQPITTVAIDSAGEAELSYNSEESVDQLIRNSGLPYTVGCGDYHRIRWIVTDSCGSSSVCEQLLNLYDCNPPVHVLQGETFTVIIPKSCIHTMFAKDFDNGGIDDCGTTQKLLRSFDPDSYQPTYPIGPCAPAIGVEVPWKIWIADAGVDSNCNDYISWSERNKTEHDFSILFTEVNSACCEPGDPAIFGNVVNADSTKGVKNVLVTLSEPGHVYPTYTTGADGRYSFVGFDISTNKTIMCERNDHPKNGVTTLDLVRIQRHLLGIQLFTNLYQQIAADVNNSQNVSAIDLIELRKLILGIYTEFPNNKSWRFVPGLISFTGAMSPGNTDFVGVKIGDVNFTANPGVNGPLLPRSLPVTALMAKNQNFREGEVIHVPIRISSNQSLTGFQFTISTSGMEVLDIIPGLIALAEDDYALFEDKMTVSWFDENNIAVSADDVLFTLVLRANQNGYLSQSLSINSDITDAEIYLDGEQTFLPVLNVVSSGVDNELQIESFAPNPWKDETTVFFYLPKQDKVTYNVMDVTGKKIFTYSEYAKEGYHNYTLKATDFSARGMLFLEINAAGNSVVEKMIVTE